MRASIAVVSAGLAMLAGCERENTRVINARRAAVSAKLDRIEGLRKALAGIPPVEEAQFTPGAAPLVMARGNKTLPTGTVAYADTLENLRESHDGPPHYGMRVWYGALLEDCGALLFRGGYPPGYDAANTPPASAQKTLDSCANLQYVFVLRTRRMADREFEGDVVAFELSSGRQIGGFPLAVTSAGRTDTVTDTHTTTTRRRSGRRGRSTFTSSKTETVTRTVQADWDQIRYDLADEIERTLKRLAPGSQWLK